MTDDLEPSRDIFEDFGDILAKRAHAAATSTAAVGIRRDMNNIFTR